MINIKKFLLKFRGPKWLMNHITLVWFVFITKQYRQTCMRIMLYGHRDNIKNVGKVPLAEQEN